MICSLLDHKVGKVCNAKLSVPKITNKIYFCLQIKWATV